MSQFLYIVCQRGAETALKAEIARQWPEFRFAYSRPGFATFKLPDAASLAGDFDLHSVFARTYGFSLGRVQGSDPQVMAREVWRLADEVALETPREAPPADEIAPEDDAGEIGSAPEDPPAAATQPRTFPAAHVWERDAAIPGEHGWEPGVTPLAEEIGVQLVASVSERTLAVNKIVRPGQPVLDVVLVEPNEWWIGWHRAAAPPSRWPGGVYPVEPPADMVSRAYLKMAEALAWSRLPFEKGDLCVELGSAPGGSSQALLDRGCRVAGIDPAEMAPALLEREGFTHVRARSKDLKRREFQGISWLTADLNVAPNYTLETVEHIVTHRATSFRGLLLTLKLLEWEFAEQLPEFLERVRGWGFEYVRARQLSYNRQEFCVAALRRREMRRKPFWREPGERRQP